MTAFSQVLMDKMLKQKAYSQFLFFSPISLFGALNICLLGAKGETYENLRNVLGFDDGKREENRLILFENFALIFRKL